MQKIAVNCATISMASSAGMSGTVTADEMNIRLRIGKKKAFGRTVRSGLWGAAIVLLPLQQVTAGDRGEGRIIPSVIVSSTVPSNGDLNPYGVAFVPPDFPRGGPLSPGDILVSNFNNGPANQQGTGTTIIKLTLDGKVAPSGSASVFFQGQAPLGLTTALGVLKRGFVLVGNLPTKAGVLIPGQAGSLLFLNHKGSLVGSATTPLDGPWDLAILDEFDHAKVFVSNVLNGTVTRLELTVGPKTISVTSATQIASGYGFRPDPNALVLGPTGLAYDAETDILYVASTADNEIFAIENAGSRTTPPPQPNSRGAKVFQDKQHLRGPLALVLAPNGHLITSNGDAVNGDLTQPSEIVEFTKEGKFIGQFNVDTPQGAAFGIGIGALGNSSVQLATVNDNTNSIIVYTLKTEE